MTTSDNSPSELDPEETDLDEIAEQLNASERSRKIQVMIIAVVLFLLSGGALWWMAENTERLFRPDVDPERAKQERLERTGDPICRAIIAGIEQSKDEYRDQELDFAEHVWGDDEDELEQLRETATLYRSRFQEMKYSLDEARFRAEHAPGDPPYDEQLEGWFENMDNEFRILEEMADKRLRMLRDEEVAERGGKWVDPEDLRDTVLMTVDENFEEFRVWLIGGGEPCAEPPEGVEPWDPDEDEPDRFMPM